MPKLVQPAQWRKYFELRATLPSKTAALRAGISPSTAWRLENVPNYRSSGRAELEKWRALHPQDIPTEHRLNTQAKHCLNDFAAFRLRYFGRKSMPWQIYAANLIRESHENAQATMDRKFIVINCPPGSGKALALDTPIPTPSGWTTIKDVAVGDLVFGADGQPVEVLAKSEVWYGHDCYEVRTDDGASVIANADHLWNARLGGYGTYKPGPKADRARKTGPKPTGTDGIKTYTTRCLAKKRNKRPQLQITAPLNLPTADLPIDPYVLGVWLGDGSAQRPRISAAQDDAVFTRAQIERAGYTTSDTTHPQAFRVGSRTGQRWKRDGLATDLRAGDLIGNKHIPDAYMRASATQRLALLQGLIDTDGHVGPTGHIEFCNTNKKLALGVQQLVLSLGAKASIREGRATLNGKDCGPKYRVTFYLADAARLPRKAALCRNGERTPSRYLTITPTESVPTQCIQVATPDGLFLAGEGMLVTHNSTLVTHDIPLWLLCRDRSVRVLIGSATETLARGYTEQIMTTLERQEPPPLEEHQRRRGAVQALSCLVTDFGRFKPDNGRNWRTGAFKIAQPNDVAATTKEASVSAFGRDSSYLGQRPDIALWDDLVTEETSGTLESREKTLRKWQREAEQRVEPGGVLVLQGQRLFADDLYRYCIDLPGDEDDEPEGQEGSSRKYTHIVFKAHYEEHCHGLHAKDDPPYDPAHPGISGCLLDPIGLSWKFLRQVQRDDEQHGTQTFRIVFQQEDADPSTVLVNPLWIEGGEDKATGERFLGCWDPERVAGVIPKVQGEAVSVLSVDSSPTKWWANGWWLFHPETERRFLIDLQRAKMRVTDAICFNKDTGTWTGLFEDWWWASSRQGRPITWLIFEAVAAERYFLDSTDLQDWARLRGVNVIKHDTHGKKRDPQYGVQALGQQYRSGRVRLPGDHLSGSKARAMNLVREVTRWPDVSTEDTVMQQWFFEFNLPNILPRRTELPAQRRPSLLKSLPDGRNLRLLVGAR